MINPQQQKNVKEFIHLKNCTNELIKNWSEH